MARKPRFIRKGPSFNMYYVYVFATLLFYGVYYYQKTMTKLNIIARAAFGNNSHRVRFPITMYPCWLGLVSPLILFVVGGLYFNTITLAAFNSFDSFGAMFDATIDAIVNMPYFANATDTTLIGIVAGWIVVVVLFAIHVFYVVNRTKDQIIAIARQYDRQDIFGIYADDGGFWNDKREGRNAKAFNRLANEYNDRLLGRR